MEPIVSRLDVTAIFCDVDDFCQWFEQVWSHQPQLPSMPKEKRSRSRLSLSEVMTIIIAFHASGARTFKDFYTLTVLPHWRKGFPNKGELQPICGTDALVFDAAVLFLEHTPRGDNGHRLYRFDSD